jgi:hypothetical protein
MLMKLIYISSLLLLSGRLALLHLADLLPSLNYSCLIKGIHVRTFLLEDYLVYKLISLHGLSFENMRLLLETYPTGFAQFFSIQKSAELCIHTLFMTSDDFRATFVRTVDFFSLSFLYMMMT